MTHPAWRRPGPCLGLCLALLGAPLAAHAQPERAEAAYFEARRAYKAGDYEAAVRHLEDAWAAKQEPIFRFHMARSYEAAGRQSEAMQAALTFISLMAERGAGETIYIEPLTESWAIVSRAREKMEAGAFELALPEARVCPKPVVTLKGEQLEPRLEGLHWQVSVPPISGGDLSVRCEGIETPMAAPSTGDRVGAYLVGAGVLGLAVGGYFGARWAMAEGDLDAIAPANTPEELGPTARETTRARQQRDDFAESTLIVGGAGAALLLTGVVVWIVSDSPGEGTALVPSLGDDGAAVWWQGRF